MILPSQSKRLFDHLMSLEWKHEKEIVDGCLVSYSIISGPWIISLQPSVIGPFYTLTVDEFDLGNSRLARKVFKAIWEKNNA